MQSAAMQGQTDDAVRFPLHFESSVEVAAPPERVFEFLDDPRSLTGHMSESTWQMGGGSMQTEVDDAKGQAVGSKITLTGKVCGVKLYVSEVVTERRASY